MRVEKASFQQKAEQYVPRETKKESKIQKIQAKKLHKKLYGWVILFYNFRMKMNNKQDKVLKSSLLKMFLLLISFKMMKKFKEEKERFKQ